MKTTPLGTLDAATLKQSSHESLSDTALLAIELIKRPSLTPNDENCQQHIIDRFSSLDFKPTWLNKNGVTNLWLIRKSKSPSSANKLMVLAGHTDVVPTGDTALWTYPPFSATIDNGVIYGRGACDMKGGLAAMMTAVERYIASNPNTDLDIAFLITSDEEGPAVDGSKHVVEYLIEHNIQPDWCILAEPSSTAILGDTIKNGRRGSLTGWATIFGKQGHVGYPHLAINPNHATAKAIQNLLNIQWDNGNEYFSPTTFQIVNIEAGTGATNVIPGHAKFDFNWRFSSEINEDIIKEKVHRCFDELKDHLGITYDIQWKLFGDPFLTKKGSLVNSAQKAIRKVKQIDAELSTTGGTSDGRFIAKTGCQIIELGPINATIHKIDECVTIKELDELSDIFEIILNDIE